MRLASGQLGTGGRAGGFNLQKRGDIDAFYLAHYKIQDGEHEHRGEIVFEAQDEADAWKQAESQHHDSDWWDNSEKEELPWWDFGDGMTMAVAERVERITDQEAEICNRLGVASLVRPGEPS